jgi:hypothetical protein
VDGSHDMLLDAAAAGLPLADRRRFVGEFGLLLSALGECPGARLAHPPDEDPEDPPLRWSPWMRGYRRCLDHGGHLQSQLRIRAQRAKDAGDPVWPAWVAVAEHLRLDEIVREIEAAGEQDAVS